MIVLSGFKLLQRIIGLSPMGGLENLIVRFIYLFVFFSGVLMFSIYFILNIRDDMYRALATFPLICGYMIHALIYLHLLSGRKHLNSLLNDLQNIVDESKNLKRFQYRNYYAKWMISIKFHTGMKEKENEVNYAKAEQQNSAATNVFMYGSLSIPVLFLSPFALVAYHLCLGKYTLNSWIFLYTAW